MKKQIFVLLLFVKAIAAYSQAFQASYTYDENGNRLTASIIWLTSSLKSDVISDTLSIDSFHSTSLLQTTVVPRNGYSKPNIDSLAGTKITIYPNPTHGLLMVKIDGVSDDVSEKEKNNMLLPSSIKVYNNSGIAIMQLNNLMQLNNVDLQSQSSGSYFMLLQLGSMQKTYTIIKN